MGILDHITINVSDYPRSKAFYEQALAPLGIHVVMEWSGAAGLGRGPKPELWLSAAKQSFQRDDQLKPITPIHLALLAESRAQVDAFHAAAIAAGATDHGAPGERPHYHAGYYGAFVIDPDGHNLEAVHHDFTARGTSSA